MATTLEKAPAEASKPFWKRPWVLPLFLATVVYIWQAGHPVITLPEEQKPLPPHDGFGAYYPLLVVHMITGAIAMLTVCAQVWPWLRIKHPAWHRASGRTYIVSTLISAGIGLVVVWWAPPVGKVGALCLLLFWLGTTIVAYRAIRRGDVARHRRFMLYSFAVATNNMWALYALLLIGYLKIPMDMNYYQEAARWIPWVGNAMLVQWWLYRTADHAVPALDEVGVHDPVDRLGAKDGGTELDLRAAA